VLCSPLLVFIPFSPRFREVELLGPSILFYQDSDHSGPVTLPSPSGSPPLRAGAFLHFFVNVGALASVLKSFPVIVWLLFEFPFLQPLYAFWDLALLRNSVPR